MNFVYSGAFLRAVSTGAVTLYQHLGPVRHHLLRPVLGLCWNALGLGNASLARRHHDSSRESRSTRCDRRGRHRSPITFEVWTSQGTWVWHVLNPERNGGTIGVAATQKEAIRDARSSIKEMSARQSHIATAQLTGNFAATEESKLNAKPSSSASSWSGHEDGADPGSTAGPLPLSANPDFRRSTSAGTVRRQTRTDPGK
jgi:hypothetical protein